MRILVDIGHPGHVHYFRNFIKIMEVKGHEISVTARDKEMTLHLLRKYKIKNICTGKNLHSIIGKAWSIIRNDYYLLRIANKFKPDIVLSFTLPFPAHVGYLLRKPVIGFGDTEHAKLSLRLTKYFTNYILTPSCYIDDIGAKQIRFNGYMELCYLHPKYFTPDPSILDLLGVKKEEKYVIMRFVSWNASHDVGHSGLSVEMKHKAVRELSKYAKVFISSEGELPDDLKQYQIKIPPDKMHDTLAFATLFVGEGATMASECACLGTPAIYVNSLEVGYCTEEEHKYNLIYNFRNSDGVMEKAMELIGTSNIKIEWEKRRQKMLSEIIDVTSFMIWFIENYPGSKKIMKENPDYQNRFKQC